MKDKASLSPEPDQPTGAALPLAGLLVLDFSQFLAGPSATLRLADMGATVIKIERPVTGDLCRQLYISDLQIDGDSTLFHTINRNKRSYAADLKSSGDLRAIRHLITKADVMVENFRPGVMRRIGLDYEVVRALNPRLVYGSVTGYGPEGPWVDFPGQDLLAQSLSGLVWLSGDRNRGPVPMGLAIADILTGAHLVQGLLAALIQRGNTNRGTLVEVSLLESIVDFQFEVLTTYLNDGGRAPQRSSVNNAHAYLGAPYGIYATADGHLALAMGSLTTLAQALDCPALSGFDQAKNAFTQRDEIKAVLASHLSQQSTAHWLQRLRAVDYWCAPVLHWHELLEHEAFRCLDMLQTVRRHKGGEIRTTRCPIRFDSVRPESPLAAPRIGEHNDWVNRTFLQEVT
jgi:crotonobetainyl-CoA:carnitine CoA-transferase CaiB-like acyl-CoA transferase